PHLSYQDKIYQSFQSMIYKISLSRSVSINCLFSLMFIHLPRISLISWKLKKF
uniref:Uncharacterized protein n=1 Tax=Solanum lycopersicum TaxID=4081 RepID=A0A3Q7ECB5_SOLLC